jgi:sugar lactone lactonase YvrE
LIDPAGRVVELEGPPPAGEGVDSVARYLPDGEPDPSFGRHGRTILRHKPHYADAIAVDARSRPIIALEAKGIVLRRYLPNGTVDKRFGPKGRLQAKGKVPSGIALDAEGRIYTVGVSKGSTATTLQIARFIPGR